MVVAFGGVLAASSSLTSDGFWVAGCSASSVMADSGREGGTAGASNEEDILNLFEGFRGELEASNAVREEIKAVSQSMDAETRKMQAALMGIHVGTDEAGQVKRA